MSRYDELLAAIQSIKHGKVSTNNDLASYCGLRPSQTSMRFWSSAPTVVAGADITLHALRWVCALRKIDDVVIPDWATLRFRLYLWFYPNAHAFDQIYTRCGGDPDLVRSGPEAGKRRYSLGRPQPPPDLLTSLTSALHVSTKALLSYSPYPWNEPHSEPEGGLALDFLALLHSDSYRSNFHFFLAHELEGISDKGAIPFGIPGGLSKRQKDYVAQARGLKATYEADSLTLPPWLAQLIT